MKNDDTCHKCGDPVHWSSTSNYCQKPECREAAAELSRARWEGHLLRNNVKVRGGEEVSRPGGNSGKGGRNYRLNWTVGASPFDDVTFGSWRIAHLMPGTRHPWQLFFKGDRVTRAHGAFEGYQRFASVERAMRWVEKRVAGKL